VSGQGALSIRWGGWTGPDMAEKCPLHTAPTSIRTRHMAFSKVIPAHSSKKKVTMSSKRRLTREEQETVIRSSAADSEWDICSADPKFIRYLKRQGYEPVPDHQLSDYLSCKVPISKVRLAKRDAKLTAKQRAVLARGVKFNKENRRSARDKTENRTNTMDSVLVED